MSEPTDKPAKPSLRLIEPGSKRMGSAKLTVKQEGFAVDIASGVEPKEAFLRHYTWNGTAKGLIVEIHSKLSEPRVAARVAELRDEYAKAAVAQARGMPDPGSAPKYTVADAMQELERTFGEAEQRGQTATMAKVVEIRMRLYGLGISDAKNPADEKPMTYEELREALDRLRAARGAA